MLRKEDELRKKVDEKEEELKEERNQQSETEVRQYIFFHYFWLTLLVLRLMREGVLYIRSNSFVCIFILECL